ncbi:MAG: NAD(+)/NADH kinase [Velocimicrobium sp.]
MEKFCVITNADKDREYETANYILDFLTSRGKSCLLIRDRFIDDDIGKYAEFEEIPKDTQCIIVLGGDGTMIQAANDLNELEIPILGVNLGTLGFLTEVEKQDIESSLEDLFHNKYQVENRIMLKGMVKWHDYEGTALNDFVISKTGGCRLIELEVYVDNEFIDTYVADGVIVSTPTGSTGYNLSAGGPVLAPKVQAMIITPICPHSLNKRSLVVDSDSNVLIRVGKTKEITDDAAVMITDGNEILYLKTGESIEIIRAKKDARIIKLSEFSFFKRMRQKLSRDV